MKYSLEAMLAPIREGAPAGDDVRYSSEFDRLQTEVDQRNSVTAPMKTDWGMVAELSFSILANQGKDLLVAAYFANALCYLDGMRGFKLGLDLLDACCKEYWSTMYPLERRMNGRGNAFGWWMENCGDFLRSEPQLSLSQEELAEVVARIEGLEAFLQEKSPVFPSLIPLVRLLTKLENGPDQEGGKPESAAQPGPDAVKENEAKERKGKKKQVEQAAPLMEEAAAAPARRNPPGAPDDMGEEDEPGPDKMPPIASDEECARAETQLLALAGGICAWQLSRATREPYYYCLNRATAWAGIASEPQHASGMTKLEPPDASFRELLCDLREQADWAALLCRSEIMLRAHPYWLDLCRYADESLAALGEGHACLREMCASLSAVFVERFPGLQGLSYADGSPFADDATKEWLGGLSASQKEKAAASFDERRNRLRETALADVRTGDILKAVGRIEACMEQAAMPAEHMRWRILLAQILNEADQRALARMHFDILLEQVREHGLEEWDKELALAVLSAAYRGIYVLESESIADIRAALLKRISRLSASVAVQLGKA